MSHLRRLTLACAVACASLGLTAAPSSAIVGGNTASVGEYPAVAQISFGFVFECTGTLISPDTVLTAGHCSSMTGGATPFASPASYPAAAIQVRIGNHERYTGGEVVPVSRVIMQPNYIGFGATSDISLLKLSRPSTKTPVKVAGAHEMNLWSVGTLETIAGWGRLEDGGDAPDFLQEARVPIVDDATCQAWYADFSPVDPTTEICAGYEKGGIDSCQGDSGGPMFGGTGTSMRVVGATSWGDGCAKSRRPGVYARVGAPALREWIRSHDPDGVA